MIVTLMTDGVVLNIGTDSRLNSGDGASAYSNFTIAQTLGTGTVQYRTTTSNTLVTVSGTYYVDTNGNVQFAPNTPFPTNLAAVTVVTAPDVGVYSGTSGNDTALNGTTGADVIYGGAGNDTISAGNGNDFVYGGTGNDTIFGGSGNDTIYGGAGNDSISGGDGNDVLYGRMGNDNIDAGAGNDTVYGGSGTDTIALGEGNNIGYGGAGGDTITAGSGADTIYGGSGRDSIGAGAGNDRIYGGDSNDTIDGGAGDDTIYGEAGNDSILGGDGNDVIYGDDVATATATTETLSWIGQGAAGTDLVNGFTQDTGNIHVSVSFQNDGGNTAIETSSTTTYAGTTGLATNSSLYLTGGAGPNVTATIDFAADPASGVSDSVSNVQFVINDIDTGGWQDVVTVLAFDANGNAVPVTFTPYGNDTVSGSTITAGSTSDSANTADGSVGVTIAGPVASMQIVYSNASTSGQALWISDMRYTSIVPTAGDDTIDGGTGDDLIFGGGGNDSISGGLGVDTLYGDDGNDILNGADGNDFLYGGNGNDTLNGGEGNDALDGGAGNDTLNGGNGADTLTGGLGNDVLNGDAGNDTLYGGDGTDSLYGGDAEDILFGGNGNDYLDGGLGEDSLSGDAGDDTLFGGAGNDTLSGGLGNDVLNGDPGNDTLFGDDGTDRLFGGDGNDTLYGGEGNDYLDGGAGNDILNGDAGDDTLLGGAGNDTLSGGSGNDVMNGDDGNDTLYGGEGNDSLYGGVGTDTLFGGAGNDYIEGGVESDVLFGDAGNDTLLGGAGDDTLSGGAGSDTLDGGTGSDVFNVADDHNQNIVIGGEDVGNGDIDTLNLTNATATTGVNVTYTGAEAGTATFGTTGATATFSQIERVVTTANADTVNASAATTGINVDTGAGNDSIIGGSGNDTITAGTGADRVEGGAGNDTISLGNDGAADVLVLRDGSGRDTITAMDTVVANPDGTYTSIDKLDVTNLHDAIGDPVNTRDVIVSDDGNGNAVLTFPNGEAVVLQGVSPTVAANEQFLTAIGIPMSDGTVSGTAGDDVIAPGYTDRDGDRVDGNDAILAGDAANDDLIEAGAGNDSVLAGEGNDRVYGGTGNDTLSGGAGNDTIYGEAGNDTLNGGSGNDVLYGGAGDDSFVISTGDDEVTGGETGETAGDLLDGSGLTANTTVTFTGTEAGVLNNADGTTKFTQIERIATGSGDDTITAGAGDQTIASGAGADVINAGAGNDTIDVGAGDNAVDTLILQDGFGDDLVSGFEAPTSDGFGGFVGHDQLDVTPLFDAGGDPVNTRDVIISDDGAGNAVLNFPNGESLTLQGISPADASNEFFLNAMGIPMPDGTVSGTAGDDIIGAGYTDGDGDTVDNNDAILPDTAGNDDLIVAGAGNDTVYAGDGNDTVSGDAGTDTIYGGAGDDFIGGGSVLDNEVYTEGDELYGGDGDDTIETANGSTTGSTVYGGDGYDKIYDLGGAGSNDTFVGGGGWDDIFGGSGDDTFVVADGWSDDFIYGGEDGEVTGDVLDASAVTADLVLDLSGPERGTLTDTASFADADPDNNNIVTFDQIENFFLGSGNDTVFGGEGDDVVDLGAGDDVFKLFGGFGNDTITGGEAGETSGDVLDASSLTENLTVTLSGPEAGTLTDGVNSATFSEIETVITGSGADTITGSTGDDTILSGAGADRINAGAGNDTLDLGLDDGAIDTVVLQDGSGNDIVSAFEAPITNPDGSFTGRDQLDVSDLHDAGGDPVNVNDVVVSDDGNGNALLSFPNGETVLLSGVSPTDAANPFYLNAIGIPMSDGTVTGTAGDDLIDNTYIGDTDGDRVDANDAILSGYTGNDDLIIAGDGNDTVIAGNGDDEVYGGNGNDTLDGGAGNDTLYGEAGDDILAGGTGDDTLDGGTGTDTFTIGDDFGNDTIVGGEDASDFDFDRIDGSGLTQNVTVNITGTESGTITNGTDTATFSEVEDIVTGSGDDTVYGGLDNDLSVIITGAGNDSIYGGAGNDFFNAGTGDDIVYGGDGNDHIWGDTGSDTLFGGAGNDVIDAGDDDDIIDGGAGADTIYGGAGNDTVTFGRGDTVSGDEPAASTGGDDTFVLTTDPDGDPANIYIDGGANGTVGDTLQLGTGADLSTLIYSNEAKTSGTVQLDDGSLLTFDNIENIICFTPGTLIATPMGARDIATLQVGDLVMTRDHGLQPIRWIQSRTVSAQGRFAPVRIRPGVIIGQERDLIVSPQHRMLFQGYRAELLFGETEVLVPAKHLVDNLAVTRDEGHEVTYIHMMFDQHEIVFAEGAATESFHPGSLGMDAIHDAAREELFAIFPQLRSDVTQYGDTARRCLKRHEAELLRV
ncbi:MAG: Ca2+-binding RTX toxin-like protein [Loktanella salsilacus]|jgi:Ca2+-binding RTX toxin-like protein